jgi:hypothetical protein
MQPLAPIVTWAAPIAAAQIGETMQPFEYFIVPIMDDKAQVAIIALMTLALMDVLFGVVNAWFVQHDFSSHEFRNGLVRKLGLCFAGTSGADLIITVNEPIE